ncbi:Hypothetical protein NCS54_00526700 [Fusarium falciforme]|uniref:Hypothetical protein n=1 Tax=Fusarium falciforme TaxID=195108 RepID=UPI002301D44C|nr:Hypothetical protein NCS54_00526700 [Fusarium falciforme]WAO87944.1 Hypothetical protein NCS54_00526700 [Fusarium falciforme]
MAGVYRRPDNNDRRRSSDYYDRRDDRERTSRDVDYRDRTSDRFRRSPPEPSSRRGSYERDESRSLSRNSSNAFDQGSRTPSSAAGGTSGQRMHASDAKPLAELLTESVHCRMQLHRVETRLKQVRADLERTPTRPTDFASVGEVLRKEVQSCEIGRAKYKHQAEKADHRLQSALDTYLKKPQAASPNSQPGAQSPQIGTFPGLDARLMELQRSTSTLFNTQLNTEIGKVRESIKTQNETNGSEVQELKANLDEEKRKNQLLEERLDRLERRLEGINTGQGIRITAIDEKFEKRISSDEQALQKFRESTENHFKQLAGLGPSASAPVAQVDISDQVKTAVTEQDGKISTLQGQLEPILESIKRLGDKSENQSSQLFTTKDVDEVVAKVEKLKQMLEDQATIAGEYQQKQNSLAEDVSSLQSTIKEQGEKQDSLDGIASSLGSTIKGQGEKQESLAADVASLRTITLEWPSEELKQLLAELPPAKDLRGLIEDPPVPRDLKRLIDEMPPAEDLRKLVAEVPKIRESQARASPRSSETPMAEEKVLQIIETRVQGVECILRKAFFAKLGELANGFGEVIDGERNRVKGLEAGIKKLDERVSTLERTVESHESGESGKRGVEELSGRLDKKFQEQAVEINSIRGNIAGLGRELETVRGAFKGGLDDVQMQLTHLSDWANNLSTKNWYREVVQQIQAHVPTHVHGQLDNISSRLEAIEKRFNDPESSNKKRKVTNGSPMVVNGNH